MVESIGSFFNPTNWFFAEVPEDVLVVASARQQEGAVSDSNDVQSAHESYTEEEVEARVKALRALLLEEGSADKSPDCVGLPPYRCSDGTEMPAADSPLLADASLKRYLKVYVEAADAANAVKETLVWRRAVLPDVKAHASLSSTCASKLYREEKRIRPLGKNRDGDFVYAIDLLWGHFVDENATEIDLLRMVILAAEAAVAKADEEGHPSIVVIAYGGPPPYLFGRVAANVLHRHYPARLKQAVVYPVPAVWVCIAQTCLFLVPEGTRQKVAVVSSEEDVIERARLLSAEQLPEDWRGGIEVVTERHHPDTTLLTGLVLEYLNPVAGDGSELQAQLETPWIQECDAP